MKKVDFRQFVALAFDRFDQGGKYALMFFRDATRWADICMDPEGWTEERTLTACRNYARTEKKELTPGWVDRYDCSIVKRFREELLECGYRDEVEFKTRVRAFLEEKE